MFDNRYARRTIGPLGESRGHRHGRRRGPVLSATAPDVARRRSRNRPLRLHDGHSLPERDRSRLSRCHVRATSSRRRGVDGFGFDPCVAKENISDQPGRRGQGRDQPSWPGRRGIMPLLVAEFEEGRAVKTYLDLLRPCSSTAATREPTAPAPARAASSATRCASTCGRASRCSPPRRCTPARDRRAALVRLRRDQRPVPAPAQRHNLGRVGRPTASSARSTATSGVLARPRRQLRRPARPGDRGDPDQPRARRHLVSGWNVGRPGRWLPPCHTLFQFYVQDGGSAASSTSAAPTSSWVCRSTSRATRC